MVKKSKKKEQRVLAQTLAQKRRLSKPARGKAIDGSFSHVKDKIMRSELTDRQKRLNKEKKSEIRKGRKDAEGKGIDPESLGFPAKQTPNTIEIMRREDETIVEAADDEVDGEDEVDEFSNYFNGEVTPKIMVTTALHTSKGTFALLKELVNVVPNLSYYKRKGLPLKQIIEYAKSKDFTQLMVFTERAKKPNGVYISNIPNGPTSFWKLTKLKLGAEITGGASCSKSYNPEILLNNFTTRLGRRVARQLASLFPQKPDLQGRRSITFHNQRDFVFFRHYRYDFRKNGERVGLAEIGPRFTLKLRYVQAGTFDAKKGEYEYQWTPDSQVDRKKMYL